MTVKTVSPSYTPLGAQPSLQSEVQRLALLLAEERGARLQLEQTLQLILQEHAVFRARLDRLDPPVNPLRAAVQRVEARGNIRVDHQTGHVSLLRSIQFQPRTTRDPPTALFSEPEVANEICRDLAEIANLFDCPMTIEGHTKGGESEFWHQLANDRARIVVDVMLAHGARAELLTARGRPGKLGKNEAKTVVFMDIENIAEERRAGQVVRQFSTGSIAEERTAGPIVRQFSTGSQRVLTPGGVVYPVSETLLPKVLVANEPHVVRRSFSAPSEVENKIIRPASVTTERDIYVDGRLVERQLSPQRSVSSTFIERDIVTADGRVIEEYLEPVNVRPARVLSTQSVNTPLSHSVRGIGGMATPTSSISVSPARVLHSSPARRIVLSSNGASTPM